jgi:hypothetical protein
MRLGATLILLAGVCAGGAHAATLALTAPIQDLSLGTATSGPAANWHVVSAGLPGGPPDRFAPRYAGVDGHEAVVASANAAEVRLLRGPGGGVQLMQDGALLPCSGGPGAPATSDLGIAPDALLASPALGGLQGLSVAATVQAVWQPVSGASGCAVNLGVALIEAALENTAAHQVIRYWLVIATFCRTAPLAADHACDARPAFAAAGRQSPFGYVDYWPGLDSRPDGEMVPQPVSIDLLPALLRCIHDLPADADHDPAHWTLAGLRLAGQVHGAVQGVTDWRDVRVVADDGN